MWLLLSSCLIREDVYLRRKAELEAMEAGDDTAVDDTDCALAAFVDADGDGWGNAAYPVVVCEITDGYSDTSGDCDDGDGGVFPGAVETCATEWDDDCDGSTEGAFDAPVWYADADADGYGDVGDAEARCDADGRVEDASDCDDADAQVHPGADEVCGNGVDDDCDADGRECRLEGEFAAVDADVVWEGEAVGGLFASAPGDIDGDGLSDVSLSADGVLHFVVSPAAGQRAIGTDDRVVFEEAGQRFLYGRTGDFDGDSDPDLAVWVLGDVWAVVRFDGPHGGLRERADGRTLVEGTDARVSGASVATADVDGDGRDDTWVGEAADGAGLVRAFDAEGTEIARVAGAGSGYLGYSIHTTDLDADGLKDLVVAAPLEEGGGAVYTFLSPPEIGSVADADVRFSAEVDAIFGCPFTYFPAGDVDGDGWQDLWFSSGNANGVAAESGEAYLHLGPFTGEVDTVGADATISGEVAYGGLGSALSVGDVDGDGRADVVLGAHDGTYASGDGAYVFYAPVSGALLESDYDVLLTPPANSDSFGWFVSAVGDSNGDGTADILSAEDESFGGRGAAYLQFGEGL